MTTSVSTQAKPSLSVRTRALTNKYHTKLADKRALLSASIDQRLRHRNRSVERSHVRRSHVSLNSDNVKPPMGESSLCEQSVINSAQDTSSSSVSSTSSGSNGRSVCRWKDCECSDIERTQLVNHIQQMHVLPQLSSRRRHFCCLWQDCRVYGRPSVSGAWLEQHILYHTDAKGKPFRCIFDSCVLRFSTSTLLERHVQRTHMRTNRSKSDTVSELSVTDKTVCQPQSDVNTSQNSAKQQTSSTVRRNLRRRKKARTYRVRRVDFYDRRSQMLVKRKLKISDLLKKYLTNECDEERPNILRQKLPNLPARLCEKPSPSTSDNSTQHPSNKEESSVLTLPEATEEVRQHISMLLRIPYTFAGQRISLDGQHQYFIRWVHGHASGIPPCIWVSEEELQLAAHLQKSL
uniref:C2H2-type domain-containing protein n=1 Tax=Trichobilharzia regenti TaxID=157069 RepID=A0AA85JTA6_TRIRE|nr:unnamed protein product [Trichobilharzia regenti]